MPLRVFIFFFSLMLLAGCYRAEKAEGVFMYNEQSGIASLDPAFARNQSVMWAVHQLYNTLVEVDSNLHLRPSLATRWQIAADRKTYTFYLRTDVWFHDNACFEKGKGRRLRAQDVVYTFNRLIHPKTASPGAWIFNGKVDTTNGFTALNDSVFQLKLLQPYPPVLGMLSMQYCSIVPKEAAEYWGAAFRSHAVGTGPFQLVAWQEGQALMLKRNENYFERDADGNRLPYLNGIKVSFYDSKATEFLLLRQGKLHFINDIDASFKDEVLTKNGRLREQWTGKLQLQTHPYLNTEYLGILVDSSNALMQNNPLRLKKIRQAINYGFDRRKMMLYLRNSIGIAAESGFVPAGLPSFNSTRVKGYQHNPQKAKALLEEAGYYKDHNPAAIKLFTIPIYADLGDYIAKALSEIGLKVQVEIVQKSLLLDMTAGSRVPFFRGSWIADYPDAENYLSVFYSKNPAPPNYTRYSNTAFDALFEKALTETVDSIRYAIYQQADQLVMDDAPVVPLWYDMSIHLVQPNVEGFYPNALNLLELRRARIQ